MQLFEGIHRFSFPTQIVFGPGALQQLPENLDIFSIKNPLIVTDPGLKNTGVYAELEAVFGVNDRSELADLSMKILRKGLKELQRRAGEAELDEAGVDAPDSHPAENPKGAEQTEKTAPKSNANRHDDP